MNYIIINGNYSTRYHLRNKKDVKIYLAKKNIPCYNIMALEGVDYCIENSTAIKKVV